MPSGFNVDFSPVGAGAPDIGWWNTPSMRGTTTANTAPRANVSAGGDLANLASIINNINLAGQKTANASRIPGEVGLEKKSSGNIAQELAGNVPSDVLRLLAQKGAERGVAMGAPDSPNADAAYLQALGLTSIGQKRQGQIDLTGATARNPVAPIFDPSRQLLTPGEDLQNQIEQQRLALEQERLQIEALKGGGGGVRGGYGSPPTTSTASPYGAEPGEIVGGYVPTAADLFGPTGNTAFGNDAYAAWNKWAAGLPAGGGGTATGSPGMLGGWDPGFADQFAGYA